MPGGPIVQPTKSDKKLPAQQQRRARLAAELRSNLHKRKEQARSRALRDGPEGGKVGDAPDAGEEPARPMGETA